MAAFVAPDLDFGYPGLKQPFEDEEKPHVKARFDAFNMYSATYKIVGEDKHEIKVFVLVPKTLGKSRCPVHVKFHGGGFATGAGDYKWWHHAHHARFAEENNAITIMPNYRLMPEHSGKDIVSDIDDFWEWFHTYFPVFMEGKNVSINSDQLMISGESAGGFLAVYSWLSQPKETKIKALYLQYPMLFYYEREPGIFFGENVSKPLAKVHLKGCIDEIEALRANGTLASISSAHPPRHMTMAYCLSATGRWKDVFDHDDIEGMVRNKSGEPATFPEIYVYHGDKDVQVPIKNTQTFVDAVKKKWPEMEEKIHFTTVKGQAHAGDYEVDEREVEQEWLKHMLEGIRKAWLY